MRSILKKLSVFIFLLFLFTSLSSKVLAQIPNDVVVPNPGSATTISQTGLGYTINGAEPQGRLYIDGNDTTVEIVFRGLAGGDGEYYLCPLTDGKKCTGVTADVNTQDINIDTTDNTVSVTVCGDGKDGLKGDIRGIGQINNKGCRTDGSDYFHEGHVYTLALLDDLSGKAPIIEASFYVYHSVPEIKIGAQGAGNFWRIIVGLSGRRPGGDNKNNYKLVLEGNNIKEDKCTTVEGNNKTLPQGEQKKAEDFADFKGFIRDGNPNSITFDGSDNSNSSSGLTPGSYILQIQEETNETGFAGVFNECHGELVYATVAFNLTQKGDIEIVEVQFDPNQFDTLEEQKAFDVPALPCKEDDELHASCRVITTAIGDIDVSPTGFVKTIFSLVLLIAGAAAIILLIFAGYRFMTSAGDKEKIAGARETITSAILGLLFIIFSLFILELIGVDILQLPGLQR